MNWRNPRIHSPDRVKIWLACSEHTEYLRDYLATRDFPVLTSPLDVAVEASSLIVSSGADVESSRS